MISFVIPAYNAEKTIKRAVDSVINQNKTNLEYEVIIINDGSTDKTEEVISKALVKAYDKNINENEKEISYIGNGINVLYVKTKNGGLSKARNEGVKRAKGDYIIFVDSDDYISKTLLKDIEDSINKGIELIKWNPILVDENGKELQKENAISFENVTGEEGFNKLFGKDNLLCCSWNYAIKRDLVPHFPEGRFHEDFATTPIMILKSKSMTSIGKYEYYYVQTEKSIMRGNGDNKKQRKKIEDMLANFDDLLEQSKQLKIDKPTDENLKIFLTNALLVILPELNNENKVFFKKELSKRKISRYIKSRNIKQFAKKTLLMLKGF